MSIPSQIVISQWCSHTLLARVYVYLSFYFLRVLLIRTSIGDGPLSIWNIHWIVKFIWIGCCFSSLGRVPTYVQLILRVILYIVLRIITFNLIITRLKSILNLYWSCSIHHYLILWRIYRIAWRSHETTDIRTSLISSFSCDWWSLSLLCLLSSKLYLLSLIISELILSDFTILSRLFTWFRRVFSWGKVLVDISHIDSSYRS